jgi:hypothetical protein
VSATPVPRGGLLRRAAVPAAFDAAAGVRGPFDGILAACLIRNLAGPDRSLRELRDLLRPGAIMAVHEYTVRDSRRARVAWHAVCRGAIIPAGWLLTGDAVLHRYPLSSVGTFRGLFRGLPRTPPWNAVALALRSPAFRPRDLLALDPVAAAPLAAVSVPETYRRLDDVDAETFPRQINFPAAARHPASDVFSRSFFAPPAQMSAAELAVMFHIYFLGSSEGPVFDVPDPGSDRALWDPLCAYLMTRGVEFRAGTEVTEVEPRGQGRFAVRGAAGGRLPAYDDGVLAWVRRDAAGGEEPLHAPVIPARPSPAVSVHAVATMTGVCEPEDIVANRLGPWHGPWFHPYSFTRLSVLPAPAETGTAGEDDRSGVSVTCRAAPALRPVVRRAAARLRRDDLAYAERRYQLRPA